MLGNSDKATKTKNQLVFKLLKSMNPYITNISQNSAIKEQLYSIINQQTSSIPQEQLEQSQLEHSFDLSHSRQAQYQDIARRIVSRVVDVHVLNGGWLGGQKMASMQDMLVRQLQMQKHGKMVREQIKNIQSTAYKNFKIQKQATPTKRIQYNQSHIFNKNYTHIQNIPTTASFMASSNNNFRNIKSGMTDYGSPHVNINDSDHYVQQNKGYRSHRDANYNRDNFGGSSSISELRLGLCRLDSPQKSYRHESDLKNEYNSLRSERKKQSNIQLGIESNLKHKRSNSQLKPHQKKGQKKGQKRLQRCLSCKRTSMPQNTLQQSTKKSQSWMSTYTVIKNKPVNCLSDVMIKKVSQKVLKQSQILDTDIIASLLHRKIYTADHSNTINFLIS